MPEAVVKACQGYGCESISYTYSEPTAWYEYMYDTAKLARKEGIKNVLVSCGHIKEKPLRKLCKLTDAANIDLKGFDKEIHKKLNGGSLESVKRTLEVCSEEKVWLEITNLVIPNWTDDMPMIKKMCKWLVAAGLGKYPLHFSRFYPQYKLDNIPPTPVSTLETARKTALDAGVEHVYIGNVPGTAASNTYCPKCGKLLIERKGFYILKNEIKNGKCSCGKEISGVWK